VARVIMLPYLTPSLERVRITSWQQRVNEETIPLQEILPHWDPGTPLNLSTTVEVDIQAVREDCRLTSTDTLRIVLVWYSSGTGLRGRGDYVDINDINASRPLTLTIFLPGELLADEVRVEMQLLLASPGKSSFELSPKRPGSILWSEGKTMALEGLASRFPIEMISFSKNYWLPENAAWYLEWDPFDLEQLALRTMRFYINEDNAKIKKAVTNPTTEVDELVRDVIEFDVGRAMIMGALENDSFVRHPDPYADGSVGSYVQRLIWTLFSNEGWEGIVYSHQQNRSRFECELQAKFKLFQKV